ncbi:N-acetyl-gamma-glutamyl-phosphate reductase [hydrothermal vent metagenome]|uniref:N-acetyl-gamma-glutamyl-phosphate reductase n=1 Tax=hydrothermal vent metagenome TaxID=652676 RepID=A0A3B1CYD1_9ZZZZ
MLKVAICGGSGYAGSELLRLLSLHREVRITAVTSERSSGRKVVELFPHLMGSIDLEFEPLRPEILLKKADLFFMALPHAASQEAVNFFYSRKKHVVDLSADFRLKDPAIYEEWYSTGHEYPSVLKKAVYGLPEIYRRNIKKTRLVANPGCYPTGALLGLYPALKEGLIETGSIVIDSKSGTSGAGRKAAIPYSFCEVNESFRAYGIATHRHTPEIEQELSIIHGTQITVNFTPHLLPVNRGILTTIYCRLKGDFSTGHFLERYRDIYRKEPFVRVYDEGNLPDVRNVRGTNFCDIGMKVNQRTGTLVVVTAIDNLLKGASGQAIQNMNIMMGFKETEALNLLAPLP